MKKMIATILAAVMLICNVPILAAGGDKTEMVLKNVKERIGNTEMFDEFSSSESEHGGEVRYEFRWSTSDKENYKYMEVAAGESGIIYNYHFYDNSDYASGNKVSISKMSRDEAYLRAGELVNELNPQLSGKLLLENPTHTESLYGNEFGFSIIHVENGYEIYGDSGHVSYNSETDRISSFYINYTENPDCQSVDGAIDAETAYKSFIEKFGLRLSYMSKRDKDGNRTYIPVYMPVQKPNSYINAISGEIEEIRMPKAGAPGSAGGATNDKLAMQSMSEEAAADKLTEAEQSEIENLNGLLSKEELVSIAKQNKYIEVPDGCDLAYYSLSGGSSYNGDKDKYYANIEFSRQAEKYLWISFRIDAKNGEILSCSKSSDWDKDANLDVKKAEVLSEQVAKDFAAGKLEEYKADEENSDKENGRFVYTRYVNGVPVDNDRIRITIGKDNKLSSYNITYSYNEFVSVDNVIAPNMAAKALFGEVDYLMVYMPQTLSEESTKYDTFVPVYIFDNEPLIIDAIDGKQLAYSGEEYIPQTVATYNDIDGHYAEEAIRTLARYGISLDGDSFRPDEKITQKDFMVLVNAAFGNSGAEPYPIAKRRGVIKEEEISSEEEVSREMAAVFLTRGMGIEEIAGLEGIFAQPFEDVTDNFGAIGILKGMGVIRGDGTGRFNPDDTITRADSAIMIYNYLSR